MELKISLRCIVEFWIQFLNNIFIGHEDFSMCQTQKSSISFEFNLWWLYFVLTETTQFFFVNEFVQFYFHN